MSITYSTNQMGPWALNWYRQRGLTKKYPRTVTEEDSFLVKNLYNVGDVIEREDIIEHWAGGRIDIRGTDDSFWEEYPYGTEISLPIMKGKDYNIFSVWLRTFETDDIWTLDELVEMYERTNPKITWDTYDENKI